MSITRYSISSHVVTLIRRIYACFTQYVAVINISTKNRLETCLKRTKYSAAELRIHDRLFIVGIYATKPWTWTSKHQ